MTLKHRCADCSEFTTRTRCPDCQRRYDRRRRPSPTERYGVGYQRRHRAVVEHEPWCHYPGGCEYAIDATNPLTAQHLRPASRYGPNDLLVPWCRRHNSAAGNRVEIGDF